MGKFDLSISLSDEVESRLSRVSLCGRKHSIPLFFSISLLLRPL